MEKIMQACDITKLEFLSYFSCEAFCLIGILINLIIFLFLSKKYNIKRISDLITFGIFAINSLISISIFIKNKILFGDFSITLLNQNFVLSNETLFLNFLLYSFFACFVLCTYKLTKRANFMGSIINSSLFLTALTSSLLFKAQNEILAFLLLDLASLFIYKFASNMRIRKYEAYSIDFILMSITSSVLFYSFFLASLLIKNETQLAIIQVCMACALLLKAGLFPVYNYLLNRHTKNNLAYSMLLFGFLPYIGVFCFAKFMQNVNIANEIFFITISIFIILITLTNTINIAKTKNLVKYIANIAYLNCSFYLIAVLFAQDYKMCSYLLFISMYSIFAIYSLLAILKINLKFEKLNISMLEGLFVKNKPFCLILSITILIAANVIPSVLSFNNFKLLSSIYTFDKISSYVILIYLFATILVTLKSLMIIKTCYSRKNIFKKMHQLTKRTTPNYVVPIVILLILFTLMFL